MKVLTILFCAVVVLSAKAQGVTFDPHTWEPPYEFPVPEHWAIERFPLPLSFAPSIPYTGTEDIRFTPGWSDAGSEEYWSYAFLWYLDGRQKIDVTAIEQHLQAYYTGLIAVNGSTIPREKLVPVVTSFRKVKKKKNEKGALQGTVNMTDYMQQKPITLNCKVHWMFIPKHTMIFFALSPQPYTQETWRKLDALWSDVRFLQ